jgi:hypothetical protein
MNTQPHDSRQPEENREDILRRDGIYIGIAGLALLNGMHFSPYFDPMFFLLKPFAPGFLGASPLLMFYFTSLLISTMTMVIGGVPAAIYERAKGLKDSNPNVLWVWLGGILLLSLPTLYVLPMRTGS